MNLSLSLAEAVAQSLAVAEAVEQDYCSECGEGENYCLCCRECESYPCQCDDEEEGDFCACTDCAQEHPDECGCTGCVTNRGEDEPETEEVIVCMQCGEENPYVTVSGSATFWRSGPVVIESWGDGLGIDTDDSNWEEDSEDEFECNACGGSASRLDDLIAKENLPVDR